MPQKSEWKTYAEKLAMGFGMGALMGSTMGLLYGGFQVLTFGPAKGKTYMGTVASAMLSTGAMMGTILGFGGLIRGEGKHPMVTLGTEHKFKPDQ
ncbi:hypothetical protein EDD86DRAFT_196489 [Gorgonomyces haynaldii]|nr:hypothetical protein EDD86DRAFT_196489 [Gorgonomyces haynaldii]